MSDADEYFLALAAATPLPTTEDEGESVDITPCPSPRACLQDAPLRPSLRLQVPSQQAPVVSNHGKKRKPAFTIFVDADAANDTAPPTSSPKRSRTTTPRTPLSTVTLSANSTPAPSSLSPDTPFSFSSTDPDWENIENYDPYTCRTPRTPNPSFAFPPTPPSTGPPPPSTPRIRRRRRHNPLAIPPVNMTLYTMLGLSDWRATEETIRSSYRRTARTLHPDHARSAPERLVANRAMQQLNAAKEVLLDARRRYQYHLTGELPWAV